MTPTRLRRLVLAAYPVRFRARYGVELAALLDDCGGGWSVTLDLARGAVLAWVRPSSIGDRPGRRRWRLQATTSTVFVLWSFSTLAIAVFARAVDDHPVPGLKAWGWAAYAVGAGMFEVTTGAVLVAGFVFWLRVVVPAMRSRDRSVLLPAFIPIAVVTIWLAASGLVAIAAHHIRPGNYRHFTAQGPHTAGGWAVLVVYAAFTVVCVSVCAASAITALSRSEIPARLLAISVAMSAAVTAVLVAVTAAATVCLIRVLLVGGLDARTVAMAVGPVIILVLASIAASTSLWRGLPEMQAADR